MKPLVFWKGDQQESFDLVNAIARFCRDKTIDGSRCGDKISKTCAAHHMLAEDQRALNGLLFVRRMQDRLRREEYSGDREQAGMKANTVEELINRLETEIIDPPSESEQTYSGKKE